MTDIKKVFIPAFISLLCISSYAIAADVVGEYKCSVFDPKKNSHYDEKLSITKTGDTYRVQFYPPDGTIPYILGTGIVNDNAFAILNWDPSSTWVGSELFLIKTDGSLDGTWATTNTTLLGTETCTKS